ncbi:MAG: hypothetical protein IPK83_02060 [Planctomycetes bacterium]|nr:hypothetical protein [Planctomycetota bacterium]
MLKIECRWCMFIVVVLLSAAAAQAWGAPWKTGEPIAPLVLKSASGGEVISIDSFRDTKLVIVHFAPWHAESVALLEDWIGSTKNFRKKKKLAVVGVMHEQDRERAALFVKWKALKIPILHDPLDISLAEKLPTVLAIDENGFVRDINPKIDTIEKEFIKKKYKPGKFEVRAPVLEAADPRVLKRRAAESRLLSMQRELGDAYMLGGTPAEIEEGMRTYSQLLQSDGKDSYSFFRLGVGFLMRSAGDAKQEGDVKQAIESLRNAVKLKSKNEIFKARLAQFDKDAKQPKGGVDFDGWVEKAKKETSNRK